MSLTHSWYLKALKYSINLTWWRLSSTTSNPMVQYPKAMTSQFYNILELPTNHSLQDFFVHKDTF